MSQIQNGAVVVAREVTRRYGEGDTAVDALRGVTVEIAPAKRAASGSVRDRKLRASGFRVLRMRSRVDDP